MSHGAQLFNSSAGFSAVETIAAATGPFEKLVAITAKPFVGCSTILQILKIRIGRQFRYVQAHIPLVI